MAFKVMHLVEYLYQGGIERFLGEFARLVPDQEVSQVYFAYEMDSFDGVSEEIRNLKKDISIYKKNKSFDYRLVSLLSQLVKEKKIDIVHTHDFGPMEYAVLLKVLNPKLKLIHTQHTLHHFINNSKYVLCFQFASYFYHSIISVSEHVKNTISTRCKFMKGSPHVVHNGIDIGKYHVPTRIGPENEKLKLVGVSRISKEKNLIHILETCVLLKGAGVGFELHHCGTGNTCEVDKVNGYIRKYGLEKNVFLHGYCNDVRDVLKKGDIFVSSSFTEGHPIALLEAMASGKICVCSDIPAHHGLSPDGIILFSLKEKKGLFKTLLDIHGNKETYFDKTRKALEDVSRNFSFDSMKNKYFEFYGIIDDPR